MAKVIIFGTRDFAELAHYYLENDSEHEVVAFTLTKDYIEEDMFKNLPIVPFEEVEYLYPPDSYAMFIPMTGAQMNKLRANFYHKAKEKGYELISYISSKATVLTDDIGDNCFILEENTIQPFVKIGNNVVMWSGNYIGHHSVIHDHVMFSAHVVLSGHCDVGSYSFFGLNSTIRDGITIAEGSFIAMSAAITKNTVADGVYKGVYSKPEV